MKDLTSHLYGNPHSGNPSSQLSTDTIEGVRELVLQFFNTNSTHYDVIFTSGCTAALKLLAESFSWNGSDGSRRKSCQKSTLDSGTTCAYASSGDKDDCIHILCDQYSGPDEEKTRHTSLTSTRIVEENTYPMEMHTELIHVTAHYNTKVVYLSDTEAIREDGAIVNNISDDGSSVFCYLEDNHTSVVAMRDLARHSGARVICITPRRVLSQTKTTTQHSSSPTVDVSDTRLSPPPYHLFAYPAQSNFSGRKYPLMWCKDLPSGDAYISGLESLAGSWLVALDAASYVCTSPLDLSLDPAHFVALSFYKMFGYPTGLGALLVRNDCAHLLNKDYYGGGTVLASISRTGFHLPRPQLHERYVYMRVQ